jgi:rhodanese-related sulfurtransferase
MDDITVDELKRRLDAGEELNLFDVREEWEYDEYNIGADLIPLPQLPQRINELQSLKNDEIILHCRSGARSGQAKEFLAQRGFTKVRNLIGGMLEWQKRFDTEQ